VLRRDGGDLRLMRRLAQEERFAALLCGQFERALTFAGELQAAPELAERVPQLRAIALLHLGRYDEARRTLDGQPPSGEARTLLAQTPVETGDLRIRRGDLTDGRRLVEEAVEGYRRLG
jgi:Flp pilus assembly protein TadD